MNNNFTIEKINRELNNKIISCVDLIKDCIKKLSQII